MSIVLSILVLLSLCLLRVNVVISILISVVIAGFSGGLAFSETVSVFTNGIGTGAPIALSYALLGAFALGLASTGMPQYFCNKIIIVAKANSNTKKIKSFVVCLILVMSIFSQNVLPVHIAFIPILIPPLLSVFETLKIDRRLIACILTFGLVTPYMSLPVGFGYIFLYDILLSNLIQNGVNVSQSQLILSMIIPTLGMIIGLLIACFFSYRKPRVSFIEEKLSPNNKEVISIKKKDILVCLASIAGMLIVQVIFKSMVFGALSGIVVLKIGGVLKLKTSDSMITQGFQSMVNIGLVMIASAGLAAVIKSGGGVESFVSSLLSIIVDNKFLGALFVLIIGLLVTLGIGSSFSTVPFLATILIPLVQNLGFSPLQIASLIGAASVLGDAGSPVSDSTVGATSGLNYDGKHSHMYGTVIPTFLHFNIPVIIAGLIASFVL